LTVIRSTFSRNNAALDAGGLTTTNGIVRIAQSRFTNNGSVTTHEVRALDVAGGVVLITETTFDHNAADGAGAIVVAPFPDFPLLQNGTLIVSDSAFVENISVFSGSGAAISNRGTVQVTNTTFARNRILLPLFPISGEGIAIANSGTLSLTNSTLAENTAGAFISPTFTSVISGNARTFLQNTIVTHNAQDTFVQDCSGPITSLGNNLISDTAGCAIVLQPSDLTGDADLGPFTDNGTPGNRHFPLLPTSRAIDAANNSVCPEKDQIGQPRKPHCDIGSIEFSHHLDELVQNRP
jgi:Right handed beta helix region